MDLNTTRRASKKNVAFIAATALAMVLLGSLLALFLATPADGVIAKGVAVFDTSLGGMTVAQAKDTLSALVDEHLDDALTVLADGNSLTITPREVSVAFDVENTVKNAYAVGRSESLFRRAGANLRRLTGGKTPISFVITVDEHKLSAILDSFFTVSDKLYATYEITDNAIVVTNGQKTQSIDPVAAKAAIINRIASLDFSSLEIAKSDANPVPLDTDALYDKLSSDKSDAYYIRENDEIVVAPELDKISFDKEAAKKLAEKNTASGAQYQIPITRTPAAMTADELESAMYRDLLGSFSSNYSTSNANRSNNVELAAAKINGTTYLPGERFSYNGVVGRRTTEAGFKAAGSYVNGEVVDEVGGGICQVSSTLYNAALYANLEIISRTCHQLTVSYVPLGRDATVDYGNIDFVFANNTAYPIKIVAYSTANKTLQIEIYGTKTDDVEVVLESVYTGSIPYSTKTEEVDWLVKGESKVKKEGVEGSTYTLYRILKSGGEVISRKVETRSRYNPTTKVVYEGTSTPVLSTEISETPDTSAFPSPSTAVDESTPAISPTAPTDAALKAGNEQTV